MDVLSFQLAGIQLQNLVHDGGRIDRAWRTVVADKSQSLLRQLCHAAYLLLRQGQVVAGVARVMARQIKQDGEGLEWIADLVGDGSGKASGCGKLFAAADGLFGLLLGSDIAGNGGRSHEFAARISQRRHG